ncbi:hypothetical protein [Enterovibrio baiacu]|uniref:hypothetical protein n=1 Tax=Enterovibrio baiacu TaxID=2491023 RepID=UPI003D10CEDC
MAKRFGGKCALENGNGGGEILCFTTSKGSYENTNGWFGNNALTLIRSFYDFAQENDIRVYVLVTTVGCERMLRRPALRSG